METVESKENGSRRRKSILELAPLELDCMNTLWPLGEATVRVIRDRLAPRCPRAYTTIMTIMDRLARKGVVTRLKRGRAYLYRPNLTAVEARAHAIVQLVEGFCGGSAETLREQLGAGAQSIPPAPGQPLPRVTRPRRPAPPAPEQASPAPPPARMDEILL
jgi:BlaI family penicillinase repressor